jgi:hypothetical protein
MAIVEVTARPPGLWRRLLAGLLHELRLIVPPTLYFLVGFNLILFTKRLILAEYLIEFSGFMLAAVSALGGFWNEAQRAKRSGSGRPCQARRAAPGRA